MRGDRGLTAEKWEKRHGAQVDVALDVGGRGGVGHLGAAIARFERTRTRKRGLGMTSVAITELARAVTARAGPGGGGVEPPVLRVEESSNPLSRESTLALFSSARAGSLGKVIWTYATVPKTATAPGAAPSAPPSSDSTPPRRSRTSTETVTPTWSSRISPGV